MISKIKCISTLFTLCFLIGCGEEATGTSFSSSSDLSQSSSSGIPLSSGGSQPVNDSKTVTASQILNDFESYKYSLKSGASWGSIDATCDDSHVDWVQSMSDRDFFADDDFDFSIDGNNITLMIKTKAQGLVSHTFSKEEINFDVFVVEMHSPFETRDVLQFKMGSKECKLGDSHILTMEVEVENSNGEPLTPKKEFVEMDESKTFFRYVDFSMTRGFSECKEGLASYLNETSLHYYSRAKVDEKFIQLESRDFGSEPPLSILIDKSAYDLEIVEYTNGYWINFEFDACGTPAIATFVLEELTQEEWEDEL